MTEFGDLFLYAISLLERLVGEDFAGTYHDEADERSYCSYCGRWASTGSGAWIMAHEDDCPLAAARKFIQEMSDGVRPR